MKSAVCHGAKPRPTLTRRGGLGSGALLNRQSGAPQGSIGAYFRMTKMLGDLLSESRRSGWASSSGTIAQVQQEAALLGWKEVPVRRGGPAISTLRPVDRTEAEPNSLSARYGKGAQPLHTDGAHLPEPPTSSSSLVRPPARRQHVSGTTGARAPSCRWTARGTASF